MKKIFRICVFAIVYLLFTSTLKAKEIFLSKLADKYLQNFDDVVLFIKIKALYKNNKYDRET